MQAKIFVGQPSDIVSEFEDTFSGEGKLEETLQIWNTRAIPSKESPFCSKGAVKQEPERLVKAGILEQLDVNSNRLDKASYRPIKIQTDHRSLQSIFRKSLQSAPSRPQGMLLRLQKFDLLVSFKKGIEMYLADTLSRTYRVPKNTRTDAAKMRCLSKRWEETQKELERINMTELLPVSEATQTVIQQATEADDTLRELKTATRQGWPAGKAEISENARDYFSFGEELSLQNGFAFKGERLVIPASIRKMAHWLRSTRATSAFKGVHAEPER